MFNKFLACFLFLLSPTALHADYISSCNLEVEHGRSFLCRPDVYWCSTTACRASHCDYNYEEAVTVRIGSACFIPKNFFRNSPILSDISGTNSGIETLAPRSFVNLPRVVNINLGFNSIRSIYEDTFVNVSVQNLNLGFNKLSYIEKNAFTGLLRLQSIDLSYNELFQQPQLPRELKNLHLSHNLLTYALLFGKVDVADFSYNKLKSIALSTNSNIERLDISMNELSEGSQFSHLRVKKLIIGFNNFIQYPGFMEFSPQEVQLYPNPWDCDILKSTWQDFYEARIKIIKASLDERFSNISDSFPVCVSYGNKNKEDIKMKFRKLYKPFINQNECVRNEDCNEEEICRNGRCWNPCKLHVCNKDNECYVEKRQAICYCKSNGKLNPFIDRSLCYFVDCFVDKDCPQGKFCNRRECV